MVGILAMGLFASTDAALDRERLIAHRVENEGLRLEITKDFFPLTARMAMQAGGFVLLLGGVFFLLIIKDLDWLIGVENTLSLDQASMSILKELGFVFAIASLECTNIIISFTRNLNLFFTRQMMPWRRLPQAFMIHRCR